MNTATKSAIVRHGESLIAAFPNCTEKDPVALCKKLRRIETSLTKPLTDYCNTGEGESDLDLLCNYAEQKIIKILGIKKLDETIVFINRDPRGCAIKLDDAWTREYNDKMRKNSTNETCRVIYTDLVGYGLLAPDLNR